MLAMHHATLESFDWSVQQVVSSSSAHGVHTPLLRLQLFVKGANARRLREPCCPGSLALTSPTPARADAAAPASSAHAVRQVAFELSAEQLSTLVSRLEDASRVSRQHLACRHAAARAAAASPPASRLLAPSAAYAAALRPHRRRQLRQGARVAHARVARRLTCCTRGARRRFSRPAPDAMGKKTKSGEGSLSEDAAVFQKRASVLRASGDALFAQGKCVCPSTPALRRA